MALALAPAAPASAAEISLAVAPAAGVRLGDPTTIRGRVTEAGAPLAGRIVALYVQRHPFRRAWRPSGLTDTTAADGSFSFSRRLDRNHRVRARLVGVLPESDTLSPVSVAFVLPAFTLAFSPRPQRAIRISQTYTVPRDVKLSAPTLFYVGRRNAERAPLRATAKTRRVRPGRYIAKATVRIPKSYGGRFAYLSCFLYSPGSGMGDPEQRCPRRSARLR
jgi:hypothetical protein